MFHLMLGVVQCGQSCIDLNKKGMEIDLNLGFTKKNTCYLETSKHIRWDTTRPNGVRGELDSRARCTLPGSQARGRKAVPVCEAKLPPSDMATAPSAAAADDVRGLARGEDGGMNIKICWIWTEVGRDRAMEEERAHHVKARKGAWWLGLLPVADRI